jgi:hypothetical protein
VAKHRLFTVSINSSLETRSEDRCDHSMVFSVLIAVTQWPSRFPIKLSKSHCDRQWMINVDRSVRDNMRSFAKKAAWCTEWLGKLSSCVSWKDSLIEREIHTPPHPGGGSTGEWLTLDWNAYCVSDVENSTWAYLLSSMLLAGQRWNNRRLEQGNRAFHVKDLYMLLRHTSQQIQELQQLPGWASQISSCFAHVEVRLGLFGFVPEVTVQIHLIE